MSISSEVRKAGPFTGNDVITDFPFSFKVFSTTDVLVVRADSNGAEYTLELGTDYTVSLNANQNTSPGGTVVKTSPLATGEKVVVSSKVANVQPVDLTNSGGFYPDVINAGLDRATIQIQQLSEKVDRAIKVTLTSDLTPDEFVAELQQGASAASASAADAAASALQAEAFAASVDPDNLVHKTGDETIEGVKTFSSSPVVPSGASGAEVPQAQEVGALSATQNGLIGQIAYFPRAAAPSGWVKANGATLSRSTYVNLFAEAVMSGNMAASEGAKLPGQYGPGNGVTTFSIPDLRGYALRALDDGKGIDTSRVLGSAQDDAIKTSAAEFRRLSSGAAIVGSTTGEFSVSSGAVSAATATASTNATGHVLQLGTATETRMKNIALLACIKY